MSAIVLCVTLNETKQFADTLERVETCGLAEHVHTAECYDADGVVVCGLEAHAKRFLIVMPPIFTGVNNSLYFMITLSPYRFSALSLSPADC